MSADDTHECREMAPHIVLLVRAANVLLGYGLCADTGNGLLHSSRLLLQIKLYLPEETRINAGRQAKQTTWPQPHNLQGRLQEGLY